MLVGLGPGLYFTNNKNFNFRNKNFIGYRGNIIIAALNPFLCYMGKEQYIFVRKLFFNIVMKLGSKNKFFQYMALWIGP